MQQYRTLYSFVVEHDYSNGKPCTALQCRLSSGSMYLARQRMLLFRQIAINEWTVMFDSMGAGPDTENDVLELDLYTTDSAFLLYTDWKDFFPSATYVLELPAAEEKLDAASVIRRLDGKPNMHAPFCTLRLKLTQELLDAAVANKPGKAELHFRAPEMQWEFIFLPRSENSFFQTNSLTLEDATGKIEFTPFDEIEVFGKRRQRTLSTERIPMRKDYDLRLQLMVQNSGNRYKRLLPVQVTPPDPRRFLSREEGLLRQICYY